jgi:chorismate synthase
MSANIFGTIFRVTTFGESHGGGLGCVIDGCPPGLKLSEKDIQPELDRRKPGQSQITSQRQEEDRVEILSGVFQGKTLGTPLAMLVRNKDADPAAYEHLKNSYRPSHGDYTYEKKFGLRAWVGGGRASARETVARVMAGAVAKKILKEKTKIEILAFVSQIKNIKTNIKTDKVTLKQVESNIVRCPDPQKARQMIKLIEKTKAQGDSVGGIITGVVKNVPLGLGEPVFDKLDALLAHACLSIPATKGFEIGAGFNCVTMTGSQHNDSFYQKADGNLGTKTNHSGGIQGGISNGENIIIRIAFKPPATIRKVQKDGRHDPCVLPRAVPIVESMIALVLVDCYLLNLKHDPGSCLL